MRNLERLTGRRQQLENCDDYTKWTVLGNDTTGLTYDVTRVEGTYALEFDKANGAANTVYAGVYKTVDLDLTRNWNLTDEIGWFCYVSAKTNVAYAFIRIGTSASHYVEYRFDDSRMNAGKYTFCHVPMYGFSSVTGNGCDFTNVDYMAVGVAFDAETDALADIYVDDIGIWPGSSIGGDDTASEEALATSTVDGTAYQDATGTPIVSPDADVGTTPVALTVPSGAKYLYLTGSAAIRYGTNATLDGSGTGLGYDYSAAYVPTPPIPVADATAVYVRIDASSGTCYVYHHWEKKA